MNRAHFLKFSAKVFPVLSFKWPLNFHSVPSVSKAYALFRLRTRWTRGHSWAAPVFWAVLPPRVPFLFLYSPGFHSREICKYCAMPTLSAGSLCHLGSELQGVTRKISAYWRLSLWYHGGCGMGGVKGELCAKARGKLWRETSDPCLWELVGWGAQARLVFQNYQALLGPPKIAFPMSGFFLLLPIIFFLLLSVQKFQRIVTEVLPNSSGARQVGKS